MLNRCIRWKACISCVFMSMRMHSDIRNGTPGIARILLSWLRRPTKMWWVSCTLLIKYTVSHKRSSYPGVPIFISECIRILILCFTKHTEILTFHRMHPVFYRMHLLIFIKFIPWSTAKFAHNYGITHRFQKKVYCARVFISFNKMHAVDSFLLISFCRKMSQTVDNFMRMKLMADPYSSVVFFGISYSLQESYASQIEVVHQCYELCCFLLQTSTRLNFATMKLHP